MTRLSNEQYERIIDAIAADKEGLGRVWHAKLSYILKDYLDKVQAVMATVPRDMAEEVLAVMSHGTLAGQSKESYEVNLTLVGMAILDTWNAMAAEVLREGELKVQPK